MLIRPMMLNAADGLGNEAGAGDTSQANVDQLMNGAQPETVNLLPKDATPEQVLKHNPFAAKGPGVGPDGKTAAAALPGKGASAPLTPAVALPAGAAQPQSNATDPSVQAIRDILLRNAEPSGGATAQPNAGGGGGEDDAFKVAWDVPQDLVAALRADDPAQNQIAVKTLVNGVANGVLQMVQQRMSELMSQAIPAMLQHRDQVQSLNTAFYGRHPHLRNPLLTETVSKVAQAVAQQRKALGQPIDPYAPEFMDAVESYIVSSGLAQRPAGHTGVQENRPAPNGGQPHMPGAGARPSSFSKAPTEDILSQIGL